MTRSATVPADELAALNADDFLGRFYAEPTGGSGEIELRLAYHRSQRVHGRLPHSPRVCLPANGWTPIESRVVKVPGGEVNLYVVSKGDERAVVLYWYQTPWQVTATELRTRVWVAVNGILHQRSDVVLVRLVASGAGDRTKGLEAALRFAPLVMSEMGARLR